MTKKKPPPRLSLDQVAGELGVTMRSVFRYLEAGHLTPIRDPGSRRVFVDSGEVERFRQERYDARHGERRTRN
jgi:hypothetical protein